MYAGGVVEAKTLEERRKQELEAGEFVPIPTRTEA